MCHHTPASLLGLFSALTKPVAPINSQLLLEQHCLSFAPFYLHSALQLQGFPLYLLFLGLLVCPVNDDGCLECQALQESTGMAKAMTNTSPKLQASLQGSLCPATCQGRAQLDPAARILPLCCLQVSPLLHISLSPARTAQARGLWCPCA